VKAIHYFVQINFMRLANNSPYQQITICCE